MAPGQIRHKLRTKIVAWSFIPTAIILLLVASTTYLAYQQVLRQMILSRDEELTRLTAAELSTSFGDFFDRLSSVARSPDIYSGVPVSQQDALQRNANNLVLFDAGVVLLDNLGVVVSSVPEQPQENGKDWSDRSYYQDMVRTPAPLISDIEPNGPNGRTVVILAVPVMGAANEFQGVLLGMFNLEASTVSPFYGAMIKQRLGGSGKAIVLDSNGRIVYATDFNRIGSSFAPYPGTTQVIGNQTGVIDTRDADGQRILAGYSPVPRSRWTLVIEENWTELVSAVQGYQRYLIVLLGLGVLLPVIVVTIGVRRIDGPIANFIAAAGRISNGTFDQPIEVHTGDELELLANQFNLMAARLQESYDTLESRVEARTRELTAVNAIAAITSRSLNLAVILPQALEKTIEIMGMQGGAVLLIDEDTFNLHLVTQQNMEAQVPIMENLTVEVSIIRQILATRQPSARLVSNYPFSDLRTSFEREGWKMAVGIPLISQGKVLGAINMVSNSPIAPTPEELAVPAAIGQQIGVAIENAKLYEQTVEYARQTEAALQAAEVARQAAERANRYKSTFLANVSHELRTPLVSIVGFARIVQKRLEERIFPAVAADDGRIQHAQGQISDNLHIILSEGQRLTSMINALLDLEKIEAGKMVWSVEPVQMIDVIHRAVAATASLVEEKNLTLDLEIPETLPTLQGDAEKLLQVLINLLSNALKFTERGPIRICAYQTTNEIVVQVQDHGIGIAPSDQPVVFDSFTQVGSPSTGKPKGTGLGLAISKEIVQHHGGHIWVESEPGKGSTFSFSLPFTRTIESSNQKLGERPT